MKTEIIKLADVINTILQSLVIVLIPNFCTKYKNSKLRLGFLIVAFWFIITLTTYLVGNSSLGTILTHVALMFMGIIVFKKDSLGATTSISIVYLFIIINTLIMSNLFLYFKHVIPVENLELAYVMIIYIPHFIMDIFILLRKDLIYRIYLFVRSKNLSMISLIITTVVVDFIISYKFIIYDLDNPIFKNIIFAMTGLFIIAIILYFAGVEKKAKEIMLLNKALEEKINDLKKVKHDYGAQISYLYGMCLMEKYDKLGNSLKSIIDGHNNIVSEVEISNNDSIISMIVNGIKHKGINVFVDEQASLEDVNVSEMEIQRVISNILNNSVTAMNEKGLITIRTYYNLNSVVIKIQNNGPKIEDKIIDRIFEIGFTTKEDNNGEHGLGLAIVKEIVERNNGKVSVSSSDSITEFVIKIPVKISV
ncbi:ATP-binding protein [Clostridium sp. 1001271B_151109_B4]|uniref:sensor histidine kinase n=1 Tax=Clostridium sp. 1001271B_151109_B4 TaxID=2787148 RepID=UPI001A9B9E7E|nr:ATP-binding protein [Clostridium sp. 1001271B_151109_B4]